MPCAAIAFGGNLPESPSAVERAVSELNDSAGRVMRRSSLHVTRPMGANAGSDFINGALLLETRLSAVQLLHRLLDIESSLGRTRTQRWEPRIIDLDLVLFDQAIVDNAELTVPHPAMWYRRFVLAPLAEIAPEMQHPITGLSVEQLATRLNQRPIVLELQCDEHRRDVAEAAVPQIAAAFDSRLVELRVSDQSGFNPAAVFARIPLTDVERDRSPGLAKRQRPFVICLERPLPVTPQEFTARLLQDIEDIVTAVNG